LDLIATEGEARVLANMRRKAVQADKMYTAMIREMSGATKVDRQQIYTKEMEQLKW
jgi:hypothetical protein